MRAILRRERFWHLVETKRSPDVFLVTIQGHSYALQTTLNSEKEHAHSGLTLSVADSLIALVVGKTDPADVWDALRRLYDIRDQQHILLLTNQLYNMRMKEGFDVFTYLMEVNNLQDHLTPLRQTITDEQLTNIILNVYLILLTR